MKVRVLADRDDLEGGQPAKPLGYLELQALPTTDTDILLGSPPRPVAVRRVILLPQPQTDNAAAIVVVQG